jgi:outer membrane beta-barrel protein
MHANHLLSVLGLTLTLGGLQPAAAQTLEEAEREEDYIRVVQSAPFVHKGRGSVTPTVGLTINDPLLQQILVGVNVNYFFGESLGIHLQFQRGFNAKRQAQSALLGRQLQPELNFMEYVGMLGVEWIPAYGKFALFNGPIVYWDAYVVGGAAVIVPRRADIAGIPAGGSVDVAPGGAVGVGTRIYLARWLTLTFEVRDFIYQESFTTAAGEKKNQFLQNLVFSVGASFFLGGGG